MEITRELFKPVNRKEDGQLQNMKPSLTYWQDVWRRLRSNKVATISLFFILFIILFAIIVPMISSYSYSDQIKGQFGQKPSWAHPLGTDTLGRDMLVRIAYGARISLSIGLVACLINLTIGVLYGGISGYFGGKTDHIMMRIVDIIYSVPLMLYVILLMVVLKERMGGLFELPVLSVFKTAGVGLVSVYLVLGLIYWVDMARIVRGQILSLKEQEYVTAAKTLGASNLKILLRHLLPNCIGPILVTITLQIPTAIFTEAFLSFVGLGVDAPMASWGSLASAGKDAIRSYPHLLLFPSIAICITMLAFNLFGDGLSDAMDPRLRK
ncbi:MAG: ABC transporter permease [Clostridia bacterium]|nr:ABC transporter permease [Clostridia bacterium]